MDRERLEKITAPPAETPLLSEEEARLREAWLALAKESDSPTVAAWSLDSDDVMADIGRRERKRRREFWWNTAVMAASVLLMAGVVGLAAWKGGRGERAHAPGPEAPRAMIAWDDDWESQAEALVADAAVVRESLQPPSEEAWIDRRLQQLFEECVRVWATL